MDRDRSTDSERDGGESKGRGGLCDSSKRSDAGCSRRSQHESRQHNNNRGHHEETMDKRETVGEGERGERDMRWGAPRGAYAG